MRIYRSTCASNARKKRMASGMVVVPPGGETCMRDPSFFPCYAPVKVNGAQ
jgi:hypothetical protein